MASLLRNANRRTPNLLHQARLATAAAQQPASAYRNALSQYPRTETTVLSNGLTVATEHNPSLHTATVGVWIDAGSRAENAHNNGAAHFLEHMAFKGTANRTQQELELAVEDMGAHLNAYTSREQTVFYAKAFSGDVERCTEIIGDILQNSKLDAAAIERERDVILREEEEVNKIPEEVVFDHLHATAFQGHGLGRTILGPSSNVRKLTRQDLLEYIKQHYTADKMVLVGAGGIEHDKLVRYAEKYFSTLPSRAGSGQQLPTAASQPPVFTGSEIKVRDDKMPLAHIALAVEGVGWNHPDYYTMLVMQAIIGSWDRAMGASSHASPGKLVTTLTEHKLANSFMSFNTSYSDTGLWGVYMTSENRLHLDDMAFVMQKEWNRLSVGVTEAEVARAKQQLKAALMLQLDGTTAVAEDIGRQLITSGKRVAPADVEQLVERVTVSDIRRCAQTYLWDREVASVGLGPIESMNDYMRTRSYMSWNRL